MLDAKTLDHFEKKWLKRCKPLEDIVFALSISPDSGKFVPEAEGKVADAKAMIKRYIDLLVDEFGTGDMTNLPPEDPEAEKNRKREERKKRMEAFQRGEKPQ